MRSISDARGQPVEAPAGERPALPAAGAALRVLAIAHNAVAPSNRRRIETLAATPGIDLALLTPRAWFEEGRWIEVREPHGQGYLWRTGRTVATNNGTRYVYLAGLFDLVRRFRPDVIDVHEEPFSFAALQALVARDVLAPAAGLVFYSAVNVSRRWRLPYRLVERALLARADGAYAPNTEVCQILRDKGMRAQPVCIPLGVDVARFAAASPLDLPAKLAGAPRPYIGFLGRLEAVKGLECLVEAAAALRQPATVVIAGEGSHRQALARLVAERGLERRVRLVGGLAFEAVPSFMRSLDVLVLPSVTILPLHREQFGRVLVEAMAAGVPVVGSSSGAIPEVVGDAGLVVPERDSAALGAALDRLLGDPRLRSELAERGRRRAAEHFDWSVVAERTRALYEGALARRRRMQGRAGTDAEVRM